MNGSSGAAAAILGALAFQHIGGYQPCPLCLMQRTPYYIAIPVVLVTLAALAFAAPRMLIFGLFAVLAALALYNAGLGVYHSGVEWEFWQGPESCSAAGDPGAGFGSGAGGLGGGTGIIDRLKSEVPPSCGEAPWRFLGLSFAGWNVVVSLALAGLAVAGFLRARETV
jgi:disulfide bond formation protein DsbB